MINWAKKFRNLVVAPGVYSFWLGIQLSVLTIATSKLMLARRKRRSWRCKPHHHCLSSDNEEVVVGQGKTRRQCGDLN